MSFIPLTPADPAAVIGSLRVGFANNLHHGERVVDVALDTLSELTHQAAVYVDTAALSTIQYQQSLLEAKTCRDVWSSMNDHGVRVRDAYFKFMDQFFACRHRAFDRLGTEDSHVES